MLLSSSSMHVRRDESRLLMAYSLQSGLQPTKISRHSFACFRDHTTRHHNDMPPNPRNQISDDALGRRCRLGSRLGRRVK